MVVNISTVLNSRKYMASIKCTWVENFKIVPAVKTCYTLTGTSLLVLKISSIGLLKIAFKIMLQNILYIKSVDGDTYGQYLQQLLFQGCFSRCVFMEAIHSLSIPLLSTSVLNDSNHYVLHGIKLKFLIYVYTLVTCQSLLYQCLQFYHTQNLYYTVFSFKTYLSLYLIKVSKASLKNGRSG